MFYDIYITVLGPSGVGKSATANTLLGRRRFHDCAAFSNVTSTCEEDVTDLTDGRSLYVLDTPALFHGDRMREKKILDEVRAHQMRRPCDFHVLVLVIRFSIDISKEVKYTLEAVKNAFGERLIRKSCIVVMTFGDAFHYEQIDEEITVPFQEWCRQIEGSLKDFSELIQERIILFDNKAPANEKHKQRENFLAMADNMSVPIRMFQTSQARIEELEEQVRQLERKSRTDAEKTHHRIQQLEEKQKELMNHVTNLENHL